MGHLCICLTTRLGLPVTAGSSILCRLGLGHGRLRMVVGNESGQTGSFYTGLSLWRGSGSVRISLKVFTSCEVCAQAVECLSRWGHTLLVCAEV